MTPLRVAYMADYYPRINETFIEREVQALRDLGVHIETFSVWQPPSPGQPPATCLRTAGLLAHFAAHLRLLAAHPWRYLRTLGLALRTAPVPSALLYFANAGLLARRVAATRCGHLHNHATGASCAIALLAAALGDFPFSFTVHGPGVFFAPAARRLGLKLRCARFVRAISYFTRSQCLLWTPRAEWHKLHVVHCGLNPDEYTMRQHTGPGSRLLFVGRLAAEKGLPILFDALAILRADYPAVQLTIVGDGSEAAGLRAHAPEVHFAGYQPPGKVAEWLNRSDILVLPSFAEGVPVVLMEAMASGLPVVATNVGGVSELVEDGVNGYLVPPAAPAALAARIGALIGDPHLRNRFGREGRAKVVREFNGAAEAARLRGLFLGSPNTGREELPR